MGERERERDGVLPCRGGFSTSGCADKWGVENRRSFLFLNMKGGRGEGKEGKETNRKGSLRASL